MSAQNLEPLPYHVELRDYLKSHERDLWNWFASARAQSDYTENLRLELLKSTYRLDAEGHPELFRNVEQAKARLKLDIPVTLYQSQSDHRINAALYFVPGEGHIVFCGPVHTLLNPEELKSVIGHELAHYHLWSRDDGEFRIADRLIQAAASDPRAAESHGQTARRLRLYTEIFADRGSLCVTADVHPVVAGLVKIETGLAQVSAASYLQQAGEIFSRANVTTEGLSHPESFIRARALALWQEQGTAAAAEIANLIEGAVTMDGLDLLGQVRVSAATRQLLECLLRPKWCQTPAMVGHAKLFFPVFQPAGADRPANLDNMKFRDVSLREYMCYVLLDFCRADPELDELPLTAALNLSQQLELDAQFEKIAARELKLKLRDVRRLKEQAAERLAQAEVSGE